MPFNEYSFLKTYRDLALQKNNPFELRSLYKNLRRQAVNIEQLEKWFQNENPESLDLVLAIDATAHVLHQSDTNVLQKIFPGADINLVKAELDTLAGLEVDNEIRKANRGYFTTLRSEDWGNLIWLEKADQQVGRTTKDAIVPAIKEYEKLFDANVASDGEVLTLSRFYPDDFRYKKELSRRSLIDEDSEPMVVGGPASVQMIDKEGHLITMSAMSNAFNDFMKNFRTRNIMLEHCLAPETKVYAHKASQKLWKYYRISEINSGDRVLTHAGVFSSVVSTLAHSNHDGQLVVLTLDNKEKIQLTLDHKVLTTSGWKEARVLTTEDVLATPENRTAIKRIEIIPYDGLVYNLQIAEYPSFAGRGIIFHNSDFQTGWPLPAYINKNGDAFKSGVDDTKLWLISEIRKDGDIAQKVIQKIKEGEYQSYSIAGSAKKTQEIMKGARKVLQVDELQLSEITLCSRGVNQGAHFDILKSQAAVSITNEEFTNFMKSSSLQMPIYSVVLSLEDDNRLVILSDKETKMTDYLKMQLQKAFPNAMIDVEDEYHLKSFVPVAKTIVQPFFDVEKAKKWHHEHDSFLEHPVSVKDHAKYFAHPVESYKVESDTSDAKITDTSKRVFEAYARDAVNWAGTPLVGGNVGGSKEERGNLTNLKRAGLITTFSDGRDMFIDFTDKGRHYAARLGIRLPDLTKQDAGFAGTVATSSDPGFFTPTFGDNREKRKQGAQDRSMNELQLFKDWLDGVGRKEKHEKLLQEYGFPREYEEDELDESVSINDVPEPWTVNEAGEEYDEEELDDLEDKKEDEYNWK